MDLQCEHPSRPHAIHRHGGSLIGPTNFCAAIKRRKAISVIHHRIAHKGVIVRVLAVLAVHRNIETTKRYIELNDHVLRAAVELV